MRIYNAELLEDFALRHAQAARPLENWSITVRQAQWKNHADLKRDFPSADYVGNKRYVFNIKGNDFRLIVAITFVAGIVHICFIGTHSEYDKIDASTYISK